jgi:hypothetical protein
MTMTVSMALELSLGETRHHAFDICLDNNITSLLYSEACAERTIAEMHAQRRDIARLIQANITSHPMCTSRTTTRTRRHRSADVLSHAAILTVLTVALVCIKEASTSSQTALFCCDRYAPVANRRVQSQAQSECSQVTQLEHTCTQTQLSNEVIRHPSFNPHHQHLSDRRSTFRRV